jgi:hypothetical protein
MADRIALQTEELVRRLKNLLKEAEKSKRDARSPSETSAPRRVLPNALFAVLCTVDGGSAGSSSTTVSFTYTVTTLSGTELGTGLSPEENRLENVPYIENPDDTLGFAYFNENGDLRLWSANEEPELESCTDAATVVDGGSEGGTDRADTIIVRRDAAADWTSGNPTLAEGEIGLETDTNLSKVGDGSTAWNDLGYMQATAGSKGDLTISGTLSNARQVFTINNNSISTAKIVDEAVTLAKLQHIGTGKKLGRLSSGSGDVEELEDEGYTCIKLAADYDVTNNASQNATGMEFSVTAGTTYLVKIEFAYKGSDAAADSAFDFAVDAGTMDGRGRAHGFGLTGTAAGDVAIAAAAAANTNLIPCGNIANSAFPYASHAIFAFTPSNSTTFRMRWGNNVATAAALSRLCKGSILKYKQVS